MRRMTRRRFPGASTGLVAGLGLSPSVGGGVSWAASGGSLFQAAPAS